MTDNEQLWEPAPVSETKFRGKDGRMNINRAPIDRVAGVVYKRSVSIKRVLQQLAEQKTPAAPVQTADPPPASTPVTEMPVPWQGHGEGVMRWLFSEQPDMAEGLLVGRSFCFLQELTLLPKSATAHRGYPEQDTVLYIVGGSGVLYHRPSSGSPIVARPLHGGDAALVAAGELYSVCNESESESLRMLVLGLGVTESVRAGGVDD